MSGFSDLVKRPGMPPGLPKWAAEATPVAPPPPEVRTLIMGDLWPNSIHIDVKSKYGRKGAWGP